MLLVSAQTQKTSFLDKLDDDRQTFAVYVSLFSIRVVVLSPCGVQKIRENNAVVQI